MYNTITVARLRNVCISLASLTDLPFRSKIYGDLMSPGINVFKSSCKVPDFSQISILSADFHKRTKHQINGNPSSVNCVGTCRQMDRPKNGQK